MRQILRKLLAAKSFLNTIESRKFATLLKIDSITDVLPRILLDSQVNHSQETLLIKACEVLPYPKFSCNRDGYKDNMQSKHLLSFPLLKTRKQSVYENYIDPYFLCSYRSLLCL